MSAASGSGAGAGRLTASGDASAAARTVGATVVVCGDRPDASETEGPSESGSATAVFPGDLPGASETDGLSDDGTRDACAAFGASVASVASVASGIGSGGRPPVRSVAPGTVASVAAFAACTGVRSTIGAGTAGRRRTSAGRTNSALQRRYPPPTAAAAAATSAPVMPATRPMSDRRGRVRGSKVRCLADRASPASGRRSGTGSSDGAWRAPELRATDSRLPGSPPSDSRQSPERGERAGAGSS